MARRLRPAHHGHRAQCRSDGPAGRGIRLARQDLRDPGRRRRQHHRPGNRRGADEPKRRRGRHLAHVPVQGRRDPRLGQAGRHARPQFRHAGGVLARPVPPARGAADHQGQDVPARAQHGRAGHPDHEPGACHALHAGARDPWLGHHQRHRQHPARLPDRPVPDHGAGHQRQDAVHRAADGRRRHVRDRRGRLGSQACAAAGRGKPPALGFARRIPGPGRQPGRPRHQIRQRQGQGAGQDAGRRHRQAAGQRQGPEPQDRRDRQPRQPLLPDAVLGPGTGRADRRRRPGRDLQAGGRAADGQRGQDHRRAQGGAGPADGHRRLLPARRVQARAGHAPERHVQPGARLTGCLKRLTGPLGALRRPAA
mmetsp:Transcript_5767/g.22463  ORF Transcript_5767/g.22463 Transcript_5767/m.22463 type:complete len:366 (-) Transcript_5767:305-1402(-)